MLFAAGVAAAAANLAVNLTRAAQDLETAAMDPVMVALSSHMDDFEDAEFTRLSPTVAGLYLHWFTSVVALIECVLRLALCAIVILVWSLFIYLSCCLSCGKTFNMPSEPLIVAIAGRYSIYSAFLCALIANVVCPFAPTLYFWKRRATLIRPPGMMRKRPLRTDEHACCTCSQEFGHTMFVTNGVSVPTWKMSEVYLSTVALLHILGDWRCRLEAWPSLCVVHGAAEAYLADASQAVIVDMSADTRRIRCKPLACQSLAPHCGAPPFPPSRLSMA